MTWAIGLICLLNSVALSVPLLAGCHHLELGFNEYLGPVGWVFLMTKILALGMDTEDELNLNSLYFFEGDV